MLLRYPVSALEYLDDVEADHVRVTAASHRADRLIIQITVSVPVAEAEQLFEWHASRLIGGYLVPDAPLDDATWWHMYRQ